MEDYINKYCILTDGKVNNQRLILIYDIKIDIDCFKSWFSGKFSKTFPNRYLNIYHSDGKTFSVVDFGKAIKSYNYERFKYNNTNPLVYKLNSVKIYDTVRTVLESIDKNNSIKELDIEQKKSTMSDKEDSIEKMVDQLSAKKEEKTKEIMTDKKDITIKVTTNYTLLDKLTLPINSQYLVEFSACLKEKSNITVVMMTNDTIISGPIDYDSYVILYGHYPYYNNNSEVSVYIKSKNDQSLLLKDCFFRYSYVK